MRCSFSDEEEVSLCFISLAAGLDHLQVMGHTSKGLQPKTTAASQEMPCSLADVTCSKPCMGVLKMFPWVSRCPSVRRKAPECVAEDEG